MTLGCLDVDCLGWKPHAVWPLRVGGVGRRNRLARYLDPLSDLARHDSAHQFQPGKGVGGIEDRSLVFRPEILLDVLAG